MKFGQFKSRLHSAWSASDSLIRLQDSLGVHSVVQVQEVKDKPGTNLSTSSGGSIAIVPPHSNSSGGQGNGKVDIELTCKGCSSKFIWTVRQQLHHESKGYEQTPMWCKTCKPPGICNLFKTTGQCRFGKDCNFSHDVTQDVIDNTSEAGSDADEKRVHGFVRPTSSSSGTSAKPLRMGRF